MYANYLPVFRDRDPNVLAGARAPSLSCTIWRYGEYEALIDIRTLDVIKGSLPRRAQALVLEWAALHRAELTEDWNLCQSKQVPKKISPLD